MRRPQGLNASLWDGAFYSFMVGMGETYFAAFALAMGRSGLMSALISTIPLLSGAIIQLLSPWGVRKMNSYRRWVVITAALQALTFLPLCYFAWNGTAEVGLILLWVTLYWAFGMATGPAWNAWLHSLVPHRMRIKFFARRSLIIYIMTFLGLALGGVLLNYGKKHGWELKAFCLVFLVAGLSRLLSAYYLAKKPESKECTTKLKVVTVAQFFKFSSFKEEGNQKQFFLFVFLFHLSVYISAPFFNPYMLTKLNLSYLAYMFLLAIMCFGRAMAMPLMNRLGQRFGLNTLATVSTVGIASLPLMWTFSDSYSFLVGVQFFSGIFWGGYELCLFLNLFDNIPDNKKTSLLSIYNLFSNLAIVIGSVLGAALLSVLGEKKETYYVLFAVSTVFRFWSIFAFPGVLAHAKGVHMKLYARFIGMRPWMGLSRRPMGEVIDGVWGKGTKLDKKESTKKSA